MYESGAEIMALKNKTADKALANKAKQTGIPRFLEQVYRRGAAAWATGHRAGHHRALGQWRGIRSLLKEKAHGEQRCRHRKKVRQAKKKK